jgi:hypothetical protein
MLTDDEPKIGNLVALVVGSLLVAIASAVLVSAFPYEPNLSRAWMGSLFLSAVWFALLVVGLRKFGKRGWWIALAARGEKHHFHAAINPLSTIRWEAIQ